MIFGPLVMRKWPSKWSKWPNMVFGRFLLNGCSKSKMAIFGHFNHFEGHFLITSGPKIIFLRLDPHYPYWTIPKSSHTLLKIVKKKFHYTLMNWGSAYLGHKILKQNLQLLQRTKNKISEYYLHFIKSKLLRKGWGRLCFF